MWTLTGSREESRMGENKDYTELGEDREQEGKDLNKKKVNWKKEIWEWV